EYGYKKGELQGSHFWQIGPQTEVYTRIFASRQAPPVRWAHLCVSGFADAHSLWLLEWLQSLGNNLHRRHSFRKFIARSIFTMNCRTSIRWSIFLRTTSPHRPVRFGNGRHNGTP